MSESKNQYALDENVASKLPNEVAHLAALDRMRSMLPYYEWVAALFSPWIGDRILDAGCGVGNFMNVVAKRSEYVMGIDLSPENVAVARERFQNYDHVAIEQLDLDEAAGHLAESGFDTIVSIDVLEHIREDNILFGRLVDIVKPGGHLLIKVPACPWLYGSVDVASDHYRRYTPRLLGELARNCGLSVLRLEYMNLAGVGPYFLKSRILKKDANFSRTFSRKHLARISRMIPWFRRLDRLTGPPFGQSLVMVARKPVA